MPVTDERPPTRTTYPPPDENPRCQCWPNQLQAFFCAYGHMTECHYPQTCREANCSHMDRYDPQE